MRGADQRVAQGRPGRVQQQVACRGEPAADDHDLGVEGRHQVGQADAQPLADRGEGTQRHRVPGGRGLGDHRAGQLPEVAAARVAEHGLLTGGGRVARVPHERIAAGVLLPAARAPALAGATARHDLHVAELPGHAVEAAMHVAVEHDRAPDAGAHRDQQRRLGAPDGAVGDLGSRRAVRVVVEHHRRAPPLLEPGPHALVAPRQVRREADPLALGVDEPRRRDPDGADPAGSGDLLDRLGERVLDQACLDAAPRRRPTRGAQDPPGRGDRGREHLGAADVDADEEGHAHIRPDMSEPRWSRCEGRQAQATPGVQPSPVVAGGRACRDPRSRTRP